MKPAIRLAALQNLHEIYVFTHDSFYVGEDGPTHEPIEQIAMLRTIPNLTVIRPAEAHEVAQAWAVALQAKGPVALLLTRQDLAPYDAETAAKVDVSRGAFVVSDDEEFDIVLVATGSEVNLALGSAKLLREKGVGVRVVSMPSQELFLQQDEAYQEEILDHFGASAPYRKLAEEFGFTPEGVLARIQEHFVCSDEEDDECGCGCDCDCDCDCDDKE